MRIRRLCGSLPLSADVGLSFSVAGPPSLGRLVHNQNWLTLTECRRNSADQRRIDASAN